MTLSQSKPASSWRLVGKIKEAHGLRGDLYVLIFSGEAAWEEELTEFCLSKDETLSEMKIFKVEKSKIFKQGLMVKPEGIADRTAAEKLKGQLFFIPEELLVADEGEEIYLDEIEGFQTLTVDGDIIGPIVGFSTNNIQDLLVIRNARGKNIEVPFVEAFVAEIDYENQKVILDLPEGLLDLDHNAKRTQDDGEQS
jgi:16S rRNA processing protein RimM